MLLTLSPMLIAIASPTLPAPTGAGLTAWLPAIVMIAGIVVLGAIMMRMFHRRERHLQGLAGQIASDLEEARALRQQLDEVHMRVSNMLSAAQRLGGRLDERVASLDLASLKMHATRASLPRPTTVQSMPNTPAAHAAVVAQHRRNTEGTVQRATDAPDSVVSRGAIGAATIEAKPSLDPLTKQVYSLADAGRSPLNIARDLNEQVGKIELILALRRQAI